MAPFLLASTSDSLLALYTKLLAGNCLIHIDREGQRDELRQESLRKISTKNLTNSFPRYIYGVGEEHTIFTNPNL